MASTRRLSLIAGGAAVAAALASVPAQAQDTLTQPNTMAQSADAVVTEVESVPSIDADMIEASAPEMSAPETAEAEVVEALAVEPVSVDSVQPVNIAATSSDALAGEAYVGQEIAQVTRPLYRGVSPFYVGVGGNLGIIDSNESGIGDFGFNVISKISFGPRFSVRPSVTISEDKSNLAIPITYNFNPISFGEFNVFPSLGAGVDIPFSGDVGLLINGGIDIPISRDFTLNAQTNWRVTNDFGLGISLGVGYNFPFFFE
ncbi:MAG: hypothetical protein IGR92_11710 [Leptolyngbyaceae cyanobacterium T60_A2020_046]|nr:hypothetical protein [Leptolyngbyaceae cyanobacterium T60_A2020_046]